MSHASLVLDTNIVSYLMKDHPFAQAYDSHIKGHLLAVSFITVGELYFGAENGNWGKKRRLRLEMALRNFVVIRYDHGVAVRYGQLVAERKRSGLPIAQNDAWIAACALRHNVPLVTHNSRDFEGITGLRIITEANPVDQA